MNEKKETDLEKLRNLMFKQGKSEKQFYTELMKLKESAEVDFDLDALLLDYLKTLEAATDKMIAVALCLNRKIEQAVPKQPA